MKCKTVQNRMSDYLDSTLSSEQLTAVEAHLEGCKHCAAEVSVMQSILSAARTLEKKSAPDSIWLAIEAELATKPQSRWQTASGQLQNLRNAVLGRLKLTRPAYKIAVGFALVSCGVLIGRFLLPGLQPKAPMGSKVVWQPQMQLAARAGNYIEKSKVLFLGVINAENEEVRYSDFSPEKRIASDLIMEAAFLKENLSDLNDAYLKQLVEELELILLEIANLEVHHDFNNVELIRSGIKRKGLLLKINLRTLEDQNNSAGRRLM